MNRIFEETLDLIYPEKLYCPCCGDVVAKNRDFSFCDRCTKDISWLKENPFNKEEGFSFDRVISIASYDYTVEKMIYDLKLSGKSYLAKEMGYLMGEVFKSQVRGDFYMLPVPMYAAKERQRGYNQASLLCKYASKRSGARVILDALIKTRPTTSMRMAGANKRKDLLLGSIKINPAYIAMLEGSSVVLVDDVITTGSTAEVCSKVLKDAGVRSVIVLTFAAVNFKGN